MRRNAFAAANLLLCFAVGMPALHTQSGVALSPERPTPTAAAAADLITLDTPEFTLSLTQSSQTLVSLRPKGAGGFDFAPGDRMAERTGSGFYQFGDLDLRLRIGSKGAWQGYSTALDRHPVMPLPATGTIIAAADLGPTLAPGIPLDIERSWSVEAGKLVLRYTLRNKTSQPVEIGALGIPMIFDNIITGKTLAQAHETCSFSDPCIGEDAGYLQVTRLNGHGPALLVIPEGRTPFEAYSPILNPLRQPGAARGAAHGEKRVAQLFTDSTPRGMTFEGFYNWMVASKAYQENEWKAAQPWNQATSILLAPGESRSVGVRFLLSPSIREIEQTLAANHRPVAVGVPGYILPQDIHARLFLRYVSGVRSIKVEPAGAIAIRNVSAPVDVASNEAEYTLDGKKWGRARVSVTYKDGTLQTIPYLVIKPEQQAVADLGHFVSTRQWFVDANDPFHRSPSPMSYDREENRIISQDSRVWIAGLSDEGGAGPYLALAMKEFGQPDLTEIAKFESFIDNVLSRQIQPSDPAEKNGVRKSIFYYAPSQLPLGYYDPKLNWTTWESWNEKQAHQLDRSYNYPHVVIAYWTMYRLARNHTGLVTNHDWRWYLQHAYDTSMAMVRFAPYYTQYGQMEGDVFLFVLEDLKREGMQSQAATLEAMLKTRADHWKNEAYPFGSEMPWDSTGQEEVYALTRYFHDTAKAAETVDAVLGYDPTIPSWGYNGSARRYWDFLYGGKYSRLERQLHHYGSGINATPLLADYRDHPADLYLLRVGYGGTMGELSNIDQQGFASAAFHAFPDKLAFDPLSGDYGSGFFGHAINTGTYLTHDPALGWLAFGGNVITHGRTVTVIALDSFRNRIYIAPMGLWLTLDAGQFQQAELDETTQTVKLTFAPADTFTPSARLRVEQPGVPHEAASYVPATHLNQERGAYVVPLTGKATTVVLLPDKQHPR